MSYVAFSKFRWYLVAMFMAVVLTLLPVMQVNAETTLITDLADTSGEVIDIIGDPAGAVGKVACIPSYVKGGNYFPNYDVDTSRVGTQQEIDYIWHGGGHAEVSSMDGCIVGIEVRTQLTDYTAAPYCSPVVRSPMKKAYSETVWHWLVSGRKAYMIDLPVDLRVRYYDRDSRTYEMSTVNGDVTNSPGTPCVRLSSTLVSHTEAYYRTKDGLTVRFYCEEASIQVLATPTGPKFIGDQVVSNC